MPWTISTASRGWAVYAQSFLLRSACCGNAANYVDKLASHLDSLQDTIKKLEHRRQEVLSIVDVIKKSGEASIHSMVLDYLVVGDFHRFVAEVQPDNEQSCKQAYKSYQAGLVSEGLR